MGLLDDAIKEHLELKRRRGGDPTEIERLEREALGPVRRVAQDAPPSDAAGAEALGGAVAELQEDAVHEGEDYGHEEDYGQEPEFEYAPEHDDGYGAEETHPAPEFVEETHPEPGFVEETHPEPGFVEEPEPHAAEPEPYLSEPPSAQAPEPHAAVPAPPPAPAPPAGGAPTPRHEDLGVETAEYDVEAAHAEEDEDNDVLEETPEFLQDTPDHDRLWFEQRPPRDFDFDK